ncbi:hypothetical protein LOCC1_G000105 [Lachnellula occidentalis]|uniref:Zn(2)-C6 fungal-type domain-containing protein n=1 Tax=Lachnellula occidentalis TaxID=215460 RepID=A0A8H8S9W5_9HELO|nr:hypothetical protein LOCC1_G000105 [Lachnellula occidentalis]
MPHSRRTLVIAIDLGTSATTALHSIAADSFDIQGKLQRNRTGRVREMRAWPGSRKNDAIGHTCLPTDLVYDRATGQLQCWGFQAQEYLDDPSEQSRRGNVFIVENIKLLLNDPNDERPQTSASRRYRSARHNLFRVLRKDPYEVFEDYLNEVVQYIIADAKRCASGYLDLFKCFNVELSLAFPSGWPIYVHQRVAEIGSKAVHKALTTHGLSNMVFGIENVYTVSETLCGVKEWLTTAADEDTSMPVDFDPQSSNLDEIQEGDCFLAIDIGAGTGCLTALRLVKKRPLQVDRLAPTQSLEVSGEAVEAEFQKRLRLLVSTNDYEGDLEQLIYHVCRKYREEKKNCGQPPRPGSLTWNTHAAGLHANDHKGFDKDCLRLDRIMLEESFDPVLEELEWEIAQVLVKHPEIKTLVFLGQFGGSSALPQPVWKIRRGNGAMTERMKLEKFVRKSATLKSYGTLVTLPYCLDSEGRKLFPGALLDAAVYFERGECGFCGSLKCIKLKVIEWAISKNTELEEDLVDIGRDGRRHHTWPFSEDHIGFDNIIIISDELPPPPHTDGKSYTVWTTAHEQNQLIVGNERLQVQQQEFGWDLAMSVKLDADGNVIGSYELHEMDECMWPAEKRKNKRRFKFRKLEHDLIWNITEMQVKVFVRPIFPNPIGPLTMQLAQERPLQNHEVTVGESRSYALVRDIELSTATSKFSQNHANAHAGEHIRQDVVDDSNFGDQRQPQAETAQRSKSPLIPQPAAQTSSQRQFRLPEHGAEAVGANTPSSTERRPGAVILDSASVPIDNTAISDGLASQAATSSFTQPMLVASHDQRSDGRRREGCYTCKSRKKKCDGIYTLDGNTRAQKCNTCRYYAIACHASKPVEWVNDPEQAEAQKDERERLIKLKRKSREESDSSGRASRDRSATLRPDFSMTNYLSFD